MRAALALAAILLSGCSVLGQLAMNDGRKLDPTRIYLQGFDIVDVGKRDAHRYACVDGPLVCEARGITVECRCTTPGWW